MLNFLGTVLLCTLAGTLLASVFISPEGAVAGAAQGFFVGLLVAWGNRKAQGKRNDNTRAAQDPLVGGLKF
jgi:hypothetical protein